MLTYYNTTTGAKTVCPFAKATAKIPEGHQAEMPVIPQTEEEHKMAAKAALYTTCGAGTFTSVRGIIMQCGQTDVAILSLSPIKTFVRDVENATHAVTEVEFDRIVGEVKAAYAVAITKYWNTVDSFV
jgi:hypothetical protein